VSASLESTLKRKSPDQAGSGIAIATLIDSTVSVTARHSDNAPIVIAVTVVLVNRDGAAGTVRLPEPAAPGDHVMTQILTCGARITGACSAAGFAIVAGNIAAAGALKMAK
jgi:hypothetical protein